MVNAPVKVMVNVTVKVNVMVKVTLNVTAKVTAKVTHLFTQKFLRSIVPRSKDILAEVQLGPQVFSRDRVSHSPHRVWFLLNNAPISHTYYLKQTFSMDLKPLLHTHVMTKFW